MTDKGSFMPELEDLLNRHCCENESDTPDFILALYLKSCLIAYNRAVTRRDRWMGRPKWRPGQRLVEKKRKVSK